MVENVQDVITLLDAEGRMLWTSPSVQRVLGYTPADLAGRGALELVHPEDVAAGAALLGSASGSPGRVSWITFRFRHRDGSWRFMEAVGKNLLDHPMVGGLVVVCRDVTERTRATAVVREAKEAAERANRAKSEFLSRMSHELRTPMNSILGFAQLLEAEVAEPHNRESVGQILRAGRHLLHLINDVLEIARIEEGRFALSLEPVAVGDAVDQAVDLVRPLAAAHDVRLEVPPGAWRDAHVTADLQRLRQVLLNLLTNAIKYNGPGGAVALSIGAPASGTLRISVRDTGRGIPADGLGRLFTPFERLGAEASGVEGTGLGLALSKKLVELMGGAIGVASEVGSGSEFWVDLPSTAPHEAPLATVAAQDERYARPGSAGTVLLIEDNPANLRLLERVFSQRPRLRLVTAARGELGLRLAAQERPDAVLLDLHLPDLPGKEVLRRLRGDPTLAGVPVVVVTADALAGRAEGLHALGVLALVTKPFDVDRLLVVVDEVLAQGAEPHRR